MINAMKSMKPVRDFRNCLTFEYTLNHPATVLFLSVNTLGKSHLAQEEILIHSFAYFGFGFTIR